MILGALNGELIIIFYINIIYSTVKRTNAPLLILLVYVCPIVLDCPSSPPSSSYRLMG